MVRSVPAMARRIPVLLSVSVLLIGSAIAVACHPRPTTPAPATLPDPSIKAELKRLDEALDRVEERLLASQASVGLWDELRDRHEKVSAVTCKTLSAHMTAMDNFTEIQREKRAGRSKNRLASRVVAPVASVR